MHRLIAALALGLAAFAAGSNVQAQTATPVQSVGSKYIEGACLEARTSDNSVVINKCLATPEQALAYDDTTGYLLQSDKCLSAPAKGEPLQVLACADAAWQKWNFEADGTLKSDSALCADILNFRRDLGTAVIGWDCTGTDNQKFFLTNVRRAANSASAAAPTAAANVVTGQTVIASYFVPGRCLEAVGARAELEINSCNRSAGQSLHFAGGVSGQVVQDGKCLASISQGAPLTLRPCASSAEQDWSFTEEGTLRNRANLCADILGFNTQNHTTVIAWECTGTDNQKWYPAVAAKGGTFTLGAQIATALKGASGVTTLSIMPGWSPYNLTGAGGKAIGADDQGNITGGQDDVIVVGGAGVMTVRFANGLAGSNVKGAPATSILPHDWAFFSGDKAGTVQVP